MSLTLFRADLHVHTCLSPCGDLDNSPRGIIEAALKMGLDLLAVCDHNSADNTAAAERAAQRTAGRLRVLAGLEICTSEEVHLLALFEHSRAALAMQDLVYQHLPPRSNRPDIFGEQVVANEDDEVEAFNDRLLIAAIDLPIEEIVPVIHNNGGLAVAAHVDRPAYGLLGQLGFVPPGLPLDALEISAHCDLQHLTARHPGLFDWPIIRSSDAHHPADIGAGWTEFLLARPSLNEIAMALHRVGGRKINKIS